ncbi:MAG: DUF72 domain-containing protein [Synergistaceae bacterium]|jgi:uncharacterized protein YecE (DUF72 family)|nr:DUF72 domain-containing protein [Synergistaceae bacterium]
MASEICIGICSWTDKTLLKSGFYPAAASTPAARLAYYASRFRVVEVDSTYYSIADSLSAFRWIGGTPHNFLFGVKSFSLFTFHSTKFASLPRWLRAELGSRAPDEPLRREDLSHEQRVRLFEEFIKPVEILRSSGRLAYLLFQFPPGWRFSRNSVAYFRTLRDISGSLPIAVEVRNNTWFESGNREKFLGALADQNIAYVAVDEPAIGWTVPPEWPITAQWGTVVRFHGRNAAGWKNPRSSVHERFDYEYARAELEEWAAKTKNLAEGTGESQKMFLMFNNCVSDKAARSAALMARMLEMESPNEPGLQRTLDI